jgi:hypothetical protein
VQYTRIAATVVAAAVSVALATTLSGCATAGGGSALSVASAKQRTLALEKSIVAYVPKSKVISSQLTTTSRVIFPCLGASGRSYWPGSDTVKLNNGVNTEAVLNALSAKWSLKKGWSANLTTSASGDQSLALKTSDGYSFTVEFDEGPVLSINALSACFSNAGLAGKSKY